MCHTCVLYVRCVCGMGYVCVIWVMCVCVNGESAETAGSGQQTVPHQQGGSYMCHTCVIRVCYVCVICYMCV